DLAMAALRRDDKKLAAEKFRASLRLREARVREHPDAAAQHDLMTTMARCGEHRQAADLAERARREASDDPGTLFAVACCRAVCGGGVGQDKPVGELTADDSRLRDHYAGLAVDALRQAVARGYRDVVSLETDPDFDPIRDRPGFKDLLA